MDTGDTLLGVTVRWSSIPSRRGVAILLGMLNAKETGRRFGRLDIWLLRPYLFIHTLWILNRIVKSVTDNLHVT